MNPDSSSRQAMTGKCFGWQAWHDRTPGSPATLHVMGACEFKTTGYAVELRPASPQGINPAIYLLDRIVTPPGGPVDQVTSVVRVHYEEPTDAKYSQVQINPEGKVIDVKEVV